MHDAMGAADEETARAKALVGLRFPDHGVLDHVIIELREIERRTGIDRTIAIGELILTQFFWWKSRELARSTAQQEQLGSASRRPRRLPFFQVCAARSRRCLRRRACIAKHPKVCARQYESCRVGSAVARARA